ncbi:MAG TPA: hypothetical protein VFM49_06015 [Chloroflexia bacterium]|jgi:hypothetical protein|nr:hypothetical protein [Chloroflexia bacterium]
MHKDDSSKHDRIRQLLDELNEWEQKYGIRYSGDPRLKSTGESNARIEDLKAQLADLGAHVHWNGQEYILDSPADPDAPPTRRPTGESGSAPGADCAED